MTGISKGVLKDYGPTGLDDKVKAACLFFKDDKKNLSSIYLDFHAFTKSLILEKILACETRKGAEKRLYEVVDELEDLKDLSDRVERSVRQALEEAREGEERETEFPGEFLHDFGVLPDPVQDAPVGGAIPTVLI